MVEEVEQGGKGRKGRKSKKGSKKPTSLFKRGSWVSNLNLGFRSGNSRKTSLASTTNSLTPLPLLAQDDGETRSSKNQEEERAPQLLQRPDQNQQKVQPGIQYLGQGVSMGGDNGRQRKVNKLGPGWDNANQSGEEVSSGGNRRKRTDEAGNSSGGNSSRGNSSGGNRRGMAYEVGLGHHRWPAGGETRVTEEL